MDWFVIGAGVIALALCIIVFCVAKLDQQLREERTKVRNLSRTCTDLRTRASIAETQRDIWKRAYEDDIEKVVVQQFAGEPLKWPELYPPEAPVEHQCEDNYAGRFTLSPAPGVT